MAGHHSGWVKVSSGPMKGRRLFVSKRVQTQFGGSLEAVTSSLNGAASNFDRVRSAVLSNQPAGLAQTGSAIAGTEMQQRTTRNLLYARQQLSDVQQRLRSTTDRETLARLNERQGELSGIIASQERSERLTQLEDDQKTLLRKATELVHTRAKADLAKQEAALSAARAKLNAAKTDRARATAQANVDNASSLRSIAFEIVDRYEGDLADLNAPVIPGRKRVRSQASNDELLAPLGLSQADRDRLMAPVAAAKAPRKPRAARAAAPTPEEVATRFAATMRERLAARIGGPLTEGEIAGARSLIYGTGIAGVRGRKADSLQRDIDAAIQQRDAYLAVGNVRDAATAERTIRTHTEAIRLLDDPAEKKRRTEELMRTPRRL